MLDNNNTNLYTELQNPDIELLFDLTFTPLLAVVTIGFFSLPVVEAELKVMIPNTTQRILAKLLLLFIVLYISNAVIINYKLNNKQKSVISHETTNNEHLLNTTEDH